MKKVLLVFNGIDYPSNLINYGIDLARQGPSVLEVVIMRPISFADTVQYPFPNDMGFAQSPAVPYLDTTENMDLIKANLRLFEDACADTGVKYRIDETVLSIDELIEQSAFSDLVLSEPKVSFGDYSLEELLADARCPVLVVTEGAKQPARAVLCYDESFSSIYAIKQYRYIFPEWAHLPTELISINPKGDNGVKYYQYLDSWLPEHFPHSKKIILEGNLQRELVSTIRKNDTHSVVVMGAYGRNAISRLFHRSLANVVFEETNAAVFIIHE